MFTTEPKIDTRSDQPYAGIRLKTSAQELGNVIPQNVDAVFDWLGQQGIEATGAPFIRYYVINMADRMDVEIGVPVAVPVAGNDRIQSGVLPAGRYASLVYRDVTRGEEGNRVLIEWAKDQGLTWDNWPVPDGDAFASRYEIFLSGPQDDPDPHQWDTEVAIRLADE